MKCLQKCRLYNFDNNLNNLKPNTDTDLQLLIDVIPDRIRGFILSHEKLDELLEVVLDIGLGVGADALNWAKYAKSYTGIDLTNESINSVK